MSLPNLSRDVPGGPPVRHLVSVTSTERRGLEIDRGAQLLRHTALNFRGAYDPRVARILIIGGGPRAVPLAARLTKDGHAVRMVVCDDSRREEVERVGAECFVGRPDRLATLRGALEHVTVACWMLATVSADPREVRALHGSRLEQFLSSLIDTTVRGVLYEAGGYALPRELLEEGERIVLEKTERNAIPVEILRADPEHVEQWVDRAHRAVSALLQPRYARSVTP